MNFDPSKLIFALNELDNLADDLARSIEQVRQSGERALVDLATLRGAMSSTRTHIDLMATHAQKVWDELLRLADRCAAVPDCPREILDLLAAAFERLGLTVFGLPGSVVDDMASIDLIARQAESSLPPDTVLQTLQVGLRNADGSVARPAKVVLSQ